MKLEIRPHLAPKGLDFEFIAISPDDINLSKPVIMSEDLMVQYLLDADEEFDDEAEDELRDSMWQCCSLHEQGG